VSKSISLSFLSSSWTTSLYILSINPTSRVFDKYISLILCQPSTAYYNGVSPYLSLDFASTPSSSNSFTIVLRAYWVAHKSGIRLLLSLELELTPFYASSSFTIPSCPLSAAYKSGVRPLISVEFRLMLSFISSSFTIALCPRSVAANSGVWL
jgi:hypothetical protein